MTLDGLLNNIFDSENLSAIQWSECQQPVVRASATGSLRDFWYLRDRSLGAEQYGDDFGFQWTELYDDYRHLRSVHLDQFMRFGINPNDLRGKICLDVGCGLGRLSEICLGVADHVIGIDLSKAVTEAGRLVSTPSFTPVWGTGDRMPLKDESVDFVFCWGVLHHTINPRETLRELWRVVKPGGLVAIWVYPRNERYLRRSLLAHHFSELDEMQMLNVANTLTAIAHTLQINSPAFLNALRSDLIFSVKNTKEYSKHILYDGLGPAFHYLLDRAWFVRECGRLPGKPQAQFVNKIDTTTILRK